MTYTPDICLTITLNNESREIAHKFALEQNTTQKSKEVYLNTLAVLAVQSFLEWIGVENDLETSDSWHPAVRCFHNLADLVIPNIGKLECRPVMEEETIISLPLEVTEDRIAYIGVLFQEQLNKVQLLGFYLAENQQPTEIKVADLEPIETLIDFIDRLESANSFLESNDETVTKVREILGNHPISEIVAKFERIYRLNRNEWRYAGEKVLASYVLEQSDIALAEHSSDIFFIESVDDELELVTWDPLPAEHVAVETTITDDQTNINNTNEIEHEEILVDTPVLLSDVVGGLGTVTDPSGKLSIIWKFDGGAYKGQVGVVSTAGMENYDLNSIEFMQEAIRRALANIIVDDTTEGAEFSGFINGEDSNHGAFTREKVVQISAGEQFFLALILNGKFADILTSREKGEMPMSDIRLLFSLIVANSEEIDRFVQLVDLTGEGTTFALENIRGDQDSERDLNDLIITVKGANVEAASLDNLIETGVISEAPKWLESDLGITILKSAVDDLTIKPVDVITEQYEFPKADQPLIGFIDTHLVSSNPDINYSNITFGKDWINDDDPTVTTGEGTHLGHVLGIVGATQDNGVGIDGINDDAPLWVSGAIGSGKWADALVEFVDAARESNQPHAVVNLSIDLTQVNPDGTVTTRYEITPQERAAIEYARQSGVLIVAASGNDGGVMSVLGQASQEFDNIITVGSVDELNRVDYSSYGYGLDILASGRITENPERSLADEDVGTMTGTPVATAKVTRAASQLWAANPELSYQQVIEILKDTATDFNTPGWNAEIGAGLLNITAAVGLAKTITPVKYEIPAILISDTWGREKQSNLFFRRGTNQKSPSVIPIEVETESISNESQEDELQHLAEELLGKLEEIWG